jgi:hypothetical protein
MVLSVRVPHTAPLLYTLGFYLALWAASFQPQNKDLYISSSAFTNSANTGLQVTHPPAIHLSLIHSSSLCFVETGSCCVIQAYLKLLILLPHLPPSAGIIGMYHQAWPSFILLPIYHLLSICPSIHPSILLSPIFLPIHLHIIHPFVYQKLIHSTCTYSVTFPPVPHF